MKLVVVLVVGVMVSGSAFADLCSCHGVLTSHPVLAGGAIRITAVQATVTTTGGSTSFILSQNGMQDMGDFDVGEVKSVKFRLSAQDPDDDVCEPSVIAYAHLTGSVTLSADKTQISMAQVSEGTWEGSFTPSGKAIYNFSLSGTISDKADQHPASNDPDLTVSGYKSKIKVK